MFVLTSCSSVPKNTKNIVQFLRKNTCGISTQKMLKKWGVPVHIQLAFVKKKAILIAMLPRHKLFKVIPYKRKSSSFGYSQAVKGTWEQYKNETGKNF